MTKETKYVRNIKNNINILREKNGLTLFELAEKAGISFGTLRTLVYHNKTDCHLSTAISLSRALNISIDDFVGKEVCVNE